MRHGNRWRWAAALAALVLVVVWLARPQPVTVESGGATIGPLLVTIEEEGVTRVRRRYAVAAPITGRLERPQVEQGDSVVAGGPIGFISAPPLDPRARSETEAHYEAALDAERTARATVTAARASLAQAEREEARISALHRQGVVAPEARERAALTTTSRRQELEAADFRAQAAAHDVEQARAARAAVGTGRIAIRSPAAGRILVVLESSERVVSAGTPIAEVGNPADLEVKVDLLSSDAVRVAPGDTMWVTGWGGTDTLRAVVRRVAPSGFTRVSALGVEEQRVEVTGELIRPPVRLGDRYRVEITIPVARAARALSIPRSALFHEGGAWRVFVLDGGRARARTVVIGLTGGERVEVRSGLSEGDRVILHPDERISEGTRVAAST